MSWAKAHRKALIPALALLLGLAWYSRPVDIYGLIPGVKEANSISLYSRALGSASSATPPSIRDLYPEEPAWNAVLETLEALRFRRPPWNLVMQFVPENTVRGRAAHEGDQHVLFMISQENAGYVQVQFFIDEWTCSSPHSNRNLTLWVTDSRKTGDALAEAIRSLLEEG